MPNSKVISMLGLARRAGKLSMGHDMVQKALYAKKAFVIIFCSDVSPRLVNEFKKTAQLHKFDTKLIESSLTIAEIHYGIGYKAGVMSVDDENFAVKIISLLEEETNS